MFNREAVYTVVVHDQDGFVVQDEAIHQGVVRVRPHLTGQSTDLGASLDHVPLQRSDWSE